ncbi:fimbria/pilus outer membrane usher protein [Frateuria defendens]|uniref:fimbria/pilus outer membrane usher protein n=1 Tax=Frateuria defendens TaxID=2219559 RepID=UPI0013793096|nr:fimbria/pilus outer membrane usher protein [Frateuria defendens]
MMCALAGVSPLSGHASDHSETSTDPDAQDGQAGVEFDPVFLPGGAGSADLARFNAGSRVTPGTYEAGIYVNGLLSGHETLRFDLPPHGGDAVPCLGGELLSRLGIALPDKTPDEKACVDLSARVRAATVRFDPGEQRLDIGVPQAFMRRHARGYVDPARWDRGITAGVLSYNLNLSRQRSRGRDSTQGYLGLTGGVNLGGWQFRHQSSLQWREGGRGGVAWQNLRNYAQHDLTALRAQLLLGDFTTTGELFDSVALRGVQVASDSRMLPDSQQGYAPVVQGIAASNATVMIRQNGYAIYETTVAAGPFRIDDLYPSGYGGDLEVTVREANGREQKFTVPYAAVTRMLRPGITRYGVAAGQFRSAHGRHGHPPVVQATWQRGLSNRVTAYGGISLSNGYRAVQLGSALNTRLGAFGLDATHARTWLPARSANDAGAPSSAARPSRRTMQGQSLRLTYSKAITATGTHVSVAAYRYSTDGHLGLADAIWARAHGYADPWRQRSAAQLTVSQPVGPGALYLTASAQNYWGRHGVDSQYQFGYTGATRWFNYAISASRSRDGYGRMDSRAFVSLSIPLGNGTLNVGSGIGRRGGDAQLAYNRPVGDAFAYGVSLTRDAAGSTAWNTSGTYRSPFAVMNGSASAGGGYRQFAFGASGALVAHAGGLTFGQGLGDTIVLVKALDAAGASVATSPGVKVDGRGYAIVPYVAPYRRNDIELNPQGLSTDVDLLEASREVVPRNGAVVVAAFTTRKGRVAVIDLKPAAGVTIPFGSDILNSQGQPVGVVSQGGRALVRGIADEGRLTVLLEGGRTCSFHYRLPPQAKTKRAGARDYAYLQVACDAGTRHGEASVTQAAALPPASAVAAEKAQ